MGLSAPYQGSFPSSRLDTALTRVSADPFTTTTTTTSTSHTPGATAGGAPMGMASPLPASAPEALADQLVHLRPMPPLIISIIECMRLTYASAFVSCCVSCRVVLRVVSCRVVSCRVVSCRVVSCHVVSCRPLSVELARGPAELHAAAAAAARYTPHTPAPSRYPPPPSHRPTIATSPTVRCSPPAIIYFY
jgi:hypothetical protein